MSLIRKNNQKSEAPAEPSKAVLANRQNALKSTGPRTAAGKLRASRNRLLHGLTGKTLLLEGEDRSAYIALYEGFIEEYAPETASEHSLVLRMTDAAWRLARLRHLEAGIFRYGIEEHQEWLARKARLRLIHPDAPDTTDHLTESFLRDARNANGLDKLGRYEARLQNVFDHSAHQLDQRRLQRFLQAQFALQRADQTSAAGAHNAIKNTNHNNLAVQINLKTNENGSVGPKYGQLTKGNALKPWRPAGDTELRF